MNKTTTSSAQRVKKKYASRRHECYELNCTAHTFANPSAVENNYISHFIVKVPFCSITNTGPHFYSFKIVTALYRNYTMLPLTYHATNKLIN